MTQEASKIQKNKPKNNMNTTAANHHQQRIIELKKVIAQIKSGNSVQVNTSLHYKDHRKILKLLFDFECWDLYCSYMQQLLAQSSSENSKEFYIELLYVCFNYRQDIEFTKKYLVEAAKKLDLDFATFWRLMLFQPITYPDYAIEADLLETLSTEVTGDFLEQTLERLTLLYEEKLHSEPDIIRTFKKLLKTNSQNYRAMVFFKNHYLQKQKWSEVENRLKALIEALKETPEESHYRLELAQIYIYHLDEVDSARDILDDMDTSAGYDKHKTKFMLFFNAGEFHYGLTILDTLEKLAIDPQQFASVYYHYGTCHQNLKNIDLTLKYYDRSLQKFFSPFVLRQYFQLAKRHQNHALMYKILETIQNQAHKSSHKNKAASLLKKYHHTL